MDTIRKARKDRGVTQCELAARLGIDQSTLRRLERGQRSVTVRQLRAIAKALGMRAAELLDEETEQQAA